MNIIWLKLLARKKGEKAYTLQPHIYIEREQTRCKYVYVYIYIDRDCLNEPANWTRNVGACCGELDHVRVVISNMRARKRGLQQSCMLPWQPYSLVARNHIDGSVTFAEPFAERPQILKATVPQLRYHARAA